MFLLPHTSSDYYRWPRLVLSGAMHPRLVVRRWRIGTATENDVEIGLGRDGALLHAAEDGVTLPELATENDAVVQVLEIAGTTPPVPRVRVAYEGTRSTVLATLEDGGPEVVVWSADAVAAAPALVTAPDGLWVAFHHNLREDTNEPDLAKWIALRFVDRASGRVLEPTAPMAGRDRDREGEEQSFEFPTLVRGSDGALLLLGRGSHRFWMQRLGADGFDARVGLGEGGWGCRGRRVAAAALTEVDVITARREKRGIVLERVDEPRGGPPALTPARVVYDRAARRRSPHIAARSTADFPRVLFGDLHQHSAHSDGIGTADEAYLRARDTHGDDFAALSDHESFLGKRIGPSEWALLRDAAERYDDPGTFTTLLAYEWTARAFPGPGHKCVYFPTLDAPIVSRDDVPEGRALVQRVGALSGIAVPHHVGWTGSNEDAHDEFVQPVWEICSCHGCYETSPHPLGQRGELADQTILAALRRGLRFGFIACSDGHGLLHHHGISRKRDPYRTGLTAVLSETNTRAAIFEALRARRCYATSGAKILLHVTHRADVMGARSSHRPSDAPLHVTVRATAPLARIVLVTEQGETSSWSPNSGAAELSLETSFVLGDATRFAYVRVEQVDAEMAWSSPVFFG